MRRLTSKDLKELNLLKHYRIIRKWACKISELTDADLELLVYLDAIDHFTKDDFNSRNYYRVEYIRWLIEQKKIDNNLRII